VLALLAAAVLVLGLAACGDGDDGGRGGGPSTHALGEEVVVEHAPFSAGTNGTPVKIGLTALAVWKGTQEEPKGAG
jgi:hypothetical protein